MLGNYQDYLRHPDLIAQKTLGEDSVSLELRLPSISIELESVSRLGSSFFDDAENIQQYMINGKKSVMPSVIKITSSSHQGFLAILADACSLRSLKKNSMDKSCVFQIHHLLAPWKVGFVLPLEKVSSGQPLYELAILLSSELKSLRIDVAPFKLGSTDSSTKWFDGAGVPFSVLLSPETLKNGICSLRTRDTTLSEQVHVGSLKQHLGKFLIPNLYASKLK
ncbi:DNA polymerase subunit gamma-2, mitochondrial-like isoform X2 [Artemia franciscana]|uniref:DNA polymerase subunit gamma-2, mitochondrial n=1 Tax=Artemia franciscana TaxID=6661 RepID=A0AA88LB25_ARTSF|nr:hypothetical protein QYM36_009119 [Artemia franciscana]